MRLFLLAIIASFTTVLPPRLVAEEPTVEQAIAVVEKAGGKITR
jgi:hypothetical protein